MNIDLMALYRYWRMTNQGRRSPPGEDRVWMMRAKRAGLPVEASLLGAEGAQDQDPWIRPKQVTSLLVKKSLGHPKYVFPGLFAPAVCERVVATG
jgi:hypothetical protein